MKTETHKGHTIYFYGDGPYEIDIRKDRTEEDIKNNVYNNTFSIPYDMTFKSMEKARKYAKERIKQGW